MQGWGNTNPLSNTAQFIRPDMLQELQDNLLISAGPQCGNDLNIDDDQFCTGEEGDTKTHCSGDSGGPITIGVSLKKIELDCSAVW